MAGDRRHAGLCGGTDRLLLLVHQCGDRDGLLHGGGKRVHIGDRLRYIPMGYFNDNSLGNITAVVTTTLGDVENNAARCLVSVIGGFLNTWP